ncbi:hypothetical protein ACETWP_17400, partial [Arthrobacter halodurans]
GPGRRGRYRSTADYLCQVLRIPYAEARARLGAAAVLLPRTTLAGQELAPVRPALAAAVAGGEVSVATALLAAR